MRRWTTFRSHFWAIETDRGCPLVGIYRIDHMKPTARHQALTTALWETRREARVALKGLKGRSSMGLYPCARVVKVRVKFEEMAS